MHRSPIWLLLAALPALIVANAFATPCPPGMVMTRTATCIDLYEWPNREGAAPLHHASATPEPAFALRGGTWDADTLCTSVGKRTCSIDEWRGACEGSKAAALVKYRGVIDERALAHRQPGLMAQLAMALPSGSAPQLAGATGAQDMLGSVEEWVRCKQGLDGWCLVGGHAAKPATSCDRYISAHAGAWHYHTTGLRCCSEQGVTLSPAVASYDETVIDPIEGQPLPSADVSHDDELQPDSRALLAAMVQAASFERPWVLRAKSKRARADLSDIELMATLNAEIGFAGHVQGDLDPWILAARQYFESRWLTRGPDGDCKTYKPRRTRCRSVGPMQVNWRNATKVYRISLLQLREPDRNVSIGYDELARVRSKCRGNLALVFTGYTRGIGRGCPRTANARGVRTCALLEAMLRYAGRLPADWRCGHEGQRLGKRTRGLVATLR